MPIFSYTVKDNSGRTTKAIAEAMDEKALVEKLQSDGYFILNIQPAINQAQSAAAVKKMFIAGRGHSRILLQDMLVFSRQLATMLEAGVSLLHSIDVINAQVESKQLHAVLTEIRNDVEQGKSFSSSLTKHPKVFNQFWVSLVEVGEASGTMPKVLNKLAYYIEQQAAFSSSIISAVVYPAILFVVAMGAVAFFALFVGPRFEGIFKEMHTQLPFITIVVLGLFKFVRINWLWVLGGSVVAVFLFRQFIKTAPGRLLCEKFFFNFPILGPIYKLIIIERFASQMATLVESGVPILYALEICEKLVDNQTCAVVVAQIREGVRDGRPLSEPLMETSFFTPMTCQMVKVGEETGELGKMFAHISAYYLSNVEAFMKRFGTLIEPFMLLFMGLVVGTIVISMFLPLINLSSGGGM